MIKVRDHLTSGSTDKTFIVKFYGTEVRMKLLSICLWLAYQEGPITQ